MAWICLMLGCVSFDSFFSPIQVRISFSPFWWGIAFFHTNSNMFHVSECAYHMIEAYVRCGVIGNGDLHVICLLGSSVNLWHLLIMKIITLWILFFYLAFALIVLVVVFVLNTVRFMLNVWPCAHYKFSCYYYYRIG